MRQTDIAIIGMAGRFPDARTIDELDQNLKAGKDSLRPISPERLKTTTLDPNGSYCVRGFLEEIDVFDHALFGIALGEAQTMDPHQRQLLEVTYEAVENAGYNVDELNGSDTAVFVADTQLTYFNHADEFVPTLLTGNISEFMASRISRCFNFTGGVSMIDTSCSSSLVALHHACNELILGNSDQAVVCAVNLEVFPVKNDHDFEVASPDGKSRPFSAQANGMSYGEAAACLLLKRLDKALADQDNIRAVIRSTAVNNNANRSASMTAPDSAAQAAVIQKAWQRAGVSPVEIGFIEAHGSGTQLGDSIEVGGLNLAIAAYTDAKQLVPISSIKSNIGHARVAAGMAGLVKAVLALEQQVLFPAVNFDEPSPLIDFDKSAVYVNTTFQPWDRINDKPRLAAISSMGLSGTNGHAVLEEAPQRPKTAASADGRSYLIPVSAKTPAGLARNLEALRHFLVQHPNTNIADIAFTLAVGRKHYPFRVAMQVQDTADLLRQLTVETPAGQSSVGQKQIVVFSESNALTDSFIGTFCTYPAFRKIYESCLTSVAEQAVSIGAKNFAFQYAFAQMLDQFGIRREAVLGIGIGKLVVEALNGRLSVAEAVAQAVNQPLEATANLAERIDKLAKQQTESVLFVAALPDCSITTGLQARAKSNEWIHTVLPNANLADPVAALLGQFYRNGCAVSWKLVLDSRPGARIGLPTYQFEKTRCWIRETPKTTVDGLQTTPAKVDEQPLILEADATATEQLIAGVWREILPNAQSFNRTDDFFKLGGNSLMATKVVNRINQQFGVRIDFEDVFDFPELKALAGFVDGLSTTVDKIGHIWKEVLKAETIKPTDDFFALGGHSLLANQVLNRINKTFGLALNFEDLYENGTVQALADFVDKQRILAPAKPDNTFIRPVAADQPYYPVSNAQRRIWILSQLQNGTLAYNNCFAFELTGTLDRTALEQAFQAVIERHESLRTTFIAVDDAPKQVIHAVLPKPFTLPFHDFLGVADKQNLTAKLASQQSNKPFDLEKGPLLRSMLIRHDNETHVLFLTIHHIISDEWSMQVLFNELVTFYNGFARNEAVTLAALPIQYKDVAVWQANQAQTGKLDALRDYWHNRLSGELPVLELPLDNPRSTVRTYAGATLHRTVPAAWQQRVQTFSDAQNCTLFMTLLAGFNTLLHRYTGQTDIVVGSPVAGRTQQEVEGLVGMFVNTLALRTNLVADEPFSELLQRVRKHTLADLSNQQYPFDQLVAELPLAKDLSRSSVFDVFLNVQTMAGLQTRNALTDLAINAYPLDASTSKFDLSMLVNEQDGQLTISLEYDRHLFSEARMERLLDHFEHLLEQVCQNPNTAIGQLQVVTPNEHDELLAFNQTEYPFPQDETINSLFTQQVQRSPQAVAVRQGDQSWTYTELDRWSDQIAQYLLQAGVQSGQRVGLFVDRSGWQVACLLGILKAGCAYVPVDLQCPPDRMAYQLANADVSVVMVDNAGVLASMGLEILQEITPEAVQQLTPDEYRIPVTVTADQTAYVIYTSGSTGRPKGVALAHRGVVNRLLWMGRQYGFTPDEIVLQKTPYVFDVSVWEFFLPLLTGGQLVLCQQTDIYDPAQLVGLIARYGITTLHFVPGMYQVFLESLTDRQVKTMTSLRQVFASGEALTPVSVAAHHQLLPGVALHNLYGPTEASVDVSYYATQGDESIIPIGRPIDNTQLWVLDRQQHVQPKGVWGEIWIGGVGVAQGYVNQPELTAERFVTVPGFGRLYRTGDRGRWTETGELEYGGRFDNQIKLRGYRIELGEIERAVASVGDVEQGIVLVSESNLVCYYTNRSAAALSYDTWQSSLGQTLPGYMIPQAYYRVEQWPMTPTGKIDRKALLTLVPPVSAQAATPAPDEPMNDVEATVVGLFTDILGQTVRLSDNFFQVGGDSIKAIRLVNAVNKALFIRLEVKDVYQHQDVRSFVAYATRQLTDQLDADALEQAARQIDQVKDKIVANRALAQQLPPDWEDIYPMSDIEKGMVYHSLLDESEGIYHDQFIYQFAEDAFDLDAFTQAFRLLVKKHTNLRCSLHMAQFQEPVKIVHRFNPDQVTIPYYDIQAHTPADQKTILEDHLLADRQQPFTCHKPGLFRLCMYRLSANQYSIVWSYHHAILDGWSYSSLFTELSQVYFRRKNDQTYQPTPIQATYRDFVIDQQRVKNSPEVINYWKAQLSDVVPTGLPLHKDRTYDSAQTAKAHYFQLDVVRRSQVAQLAHQQRVSASTVYLTALYALLRSYNTTDDLTLGLVTHARPERNESERMIGCFLNTVPLRVRVPGEAAGNDWLKTVHAQVIAQKAYDKLPLADIRRCAGKTTINDALFTLHYSYVDFHVYEEMHDETVTQDALTGGLQSTNALFDFMVNETGGQTTVVMRGQSALYSPEEMTQLQQRYVELLERLVETPDEPLMTQTKEIVDTNTVVEGFAAAVDQHRDQPALRCQERLITYDELNKQANRIGWRLRNEFGVRPDEVVALLMPKNEWAICSILGVLKAGAAYLPIDPAYPSSVIDYILTDSKPTVVLTVASLVKQLPNADDSVRYWVVDEENYLPEATDDLPMVHTASDLAYIIYTSGSTGRPKGVEIEHRSLWNYISWSNRYYYNNENGFDFGLFTSLAFDLTVTGIFATLLRGDTLYLFDDDDLGDTLRAVFTENPTIKSVKLTPSHIRMLAGLDLPKTDVTHIIVGGEQLLPYHIEVMRSLNPGIAIDNEYGPTETTVGCTIERVLDANAITIGRPIDNTTIYILNENREPAAVGEEGELFIGGLGLARGYHQKPALTQERFIRHPANPDERLYRTGDVALWLADGSIQLLGRKDEQVKVNGYRIEIEGIESVINQFEGISATAVIAHENRLIAFYQADGELPLTDLQAYVAGHLPHYMVPKQWMPVTAIPLTVNGKTDKKALLAQWLNRIESTVTEVIPVTTRPTTPQEQLLQDVFAVVFGKRIGVDDDYWNLNIDSIRAVQVSARLSDKGYKLLIRQILQDKTIAGLANQLTPITHLKTVQPVARPVVSDLSASLSSSELNTLFD